jgi:hypothetical protein
MVGRAVRFFKLVAGSGPGRRPNHQGATFGSFSGGPARLNDFNLVALGSVNESDNATGTLVRPVA